MWRAPSNSRRPPRSVTPTACSPVAAARRAGAVAIQSRDRARTGAAGSWLSDSTSWTSRASSCRGRVVLVLTVADRASSANRGGGPFAAPNRRALGVEWGRRRIPPPSPALDSASEGLIGWSMPGSANAVVTLLVVATLMVMAATAKRQLVWRPRRPARPGLCRSVQRASSRPPGSPMTLRRSGHGQTEMGHRPDRPPRLDAAPCLR